MTLKNSLSENKSLSIWRLTLKNVKRHVWLPILALLGFVLAIPVASILVINNVHEWDFSDDPRVKLEYFYDWGGDLSMFWQIASAMIIVVGALMTMLVMFRYLHVRAQVDFYHSLPVRREQFFAANLLAGFLVFLAPYLLATLLNLLVLAVSGWVHYVNMALYMQMILFNILVYVLFMACGCLAMQLSGTMPSALKIMVLTFGLAPLLAGVYEILGSVFFDTWVSMFSNLSNLLLKASVLERYFWISFAARGDLDYDFQLQIVCWQDWLAAAGLAVILLGASLALYRRRNSEAAGSTLAFRWQKPLYKYPLVICSGLLLGLFFFLAGEMHLLWLYFGAVLGTMFMALLLEIFIKSDFKAVKKGWRSAVLASVAVCLVLSAYAFDWFGFDRRIPAADKVQAVYLDSYNLRSMTGNDYSYYGYFFDDYWQLNPQHSLELGSSLKFSEPDNVAAVLAMAESAQNRAAGFNSYDYYYYNGPYFVENVSVYYQMQNGSIIGRHYYIYNPVNYLPTYQKLLGSDEWRQQLLINSLDLEHVALFSVDSYQLDYNDYYFENLLDAETERQIVQSLQQDYAQISADDLLYSAPIGNLDIGVFRDRTYNPLGNHYDYNGLKRYDFRIYPGMTNTIELLNQATDGFLEKKVSLAQIAEVREYQLYDNNDLAEDWNENAEYYYTDNGYQLLNTYRPATDAEFIEEIIQNCVSENALWRSPFCSPNFYDKYYDVYYYPINDEGDFIYNEYGGIEGTDLLRLYPAPSREMYEQLFSE